MIHVFDCSSTDHHETQASAWRAYQGESHKTNWGQLVTFSLASHFVPMQEFFPSVLKPVAHSTCNTNFPALAYCGKGFCGRLKNNFKNHTILITFEEV